MNESLEEAIKTSNKRKIKKYEQLYASKIENIGWNVQILGNTEFTKSSKNTWNTKCQICI